jgi:hypothetical protein
MNTYQALHFLSFALAHIWDDGAEATTTVERNSMKPPSKRGPATKLAIIPPSPSSASASRNCPSYMRLNSVTSTHPTETTTGAHVPSLSSTHPLHDRRQSTPCYPFLSDTCSPLHRFGLRPFIPPKGDILRSTLPMSRKNINH